MTFFTTLLKPRTVAQGPLPQIEAAIDSRRLHLRLARESDWAQWEEARSRSRAYLCPWEPTWAREALTFDHFAANIRRQTREWREGKGYAFSIFLKNEAENSADSFRAHRLIGGVTLSEVSRGIAQKATLGYWLDEPHAGQGLMTEAASLACRFAFDTLLLHRIEAACLPHNHASIRVLEKLGFDPEGRAKEYLRINGKWEDHLLWGLVKTPRTSA